jgi:small subunit ribosomal protein S4
MLRKHKKFSWPRKLYDQDRIKEENKLVERFGLKNKREIWRCEAKVAYYRSRAKALITASAHEQKTLFNKLNAIGLKVESIADVLALTKEDLMKRRLSSVLVAKNIAATPKQARQMIVHKRIMTDGKVVSSPGYLVPIAEEGKISLKSAKGVAQ